MTDLRGYSREFITEFILLYRQNPCLWKIKSAEYSNRNKKQAAYDILCDKLKEKDPTATRDAVIKKINSLRSSFRKETKKVKASEKSGAGEDDIYKPSLWYFDQLLFLLDQELPRESTSNMNEKDETEEAAGDISEDEGNDFTSPILSPDTPSSIQSQTSSSQTNRPKRKGRNDKSDEILGLVANKLKSSDFQQYESYGKHIAEELRTLTPEQAVFCQKLINDAIFEAKLGGLGRSSKIVSEQSNFQPSESSRNTTQYTPHIYTNTNMVLRQSQSQGSRYDTAHNQESRYDAAQNQDSRYDTAQYFHTFNENV